MKLTNKIKIDIISDVVCPWCVIGYKRLEKAIQELGVEDKFEIIWNPFEINPDIPEQGRDAFEYMKSKYGMSEQECAKYQEDRKKNFEEVGFDFEFYKGKRVVNTQKAHILLEFAKEFGKQTELKLALFRAFFSEKKDVSNNTQLAQIAKSIGLDEQASLKRLEDESAKKRILQQQSHWHEHGVTAVPTMIFNDKTMMNGAYPVGTYKEVLTELLEKKI